MSVGIAFGLGVEGVKEAHDMALAAALEQVEERYTLYRRPGGVGNGKLVVASFIHTTSRNFDPQLHSHNLILNLVQTPEETWKTNWNRSSSRTRSRWGISTARSSHTNSVSAASRSLSPTAH